MSYEGSQLAAIVKALTQLVTIESQRLDVENQLLDFLRTQAYNAPVGFRVTETALSTNKEKIMPLKAEVDLQILDDGKGVLFTLQPISKSGADVPLPAGDTVTATSSAPASLAVVPDPGDPSATPPRPADTTGLVFLGTVPTPVVDATGIVVTFAAAFGQTAAAPIDVTADNSPVGFSITESAL